MSGSPNSGSSAASSSSSQSRRTRSPARSVSDSGRAANALALGHVLGGAAVGLAVLHARGRVVGAAGGHALVGVALAGDRGDRGQDLVGEPRAVLLGLRRGGDADDDLVGVDLLERDVRLGADGDADAAGAAAPGPRRA